MLIPFQGLLTKYNINPTGVLHVGAHWAEEAHDYYSNGVQRTVWVEANPECIYKAISVLAPYPEHLIFNDCCTDTDDKQVTFNISNHEGQSSSILQMGTHKTAHPEVDYISTISLKTKRLDTLFRKNKLNITDYQFINMDIQGSELLALKGMGELLHQVDYLYLECNDAYLYEGCSLTHEVDEYVAQYGFTRVEKVMAGNFMWGDSFYLRK